MKRGGGVNGGRVGRGGGTGCGMDDEEGSEVVGLSVRGLTLYLERYSSLLLDEFNRGSFCTCIKLMLNKS